MLPGSSAQLQKADKKSGRCSSILGVFNHALSGGITMNRTTAVLAAVVLCVVGPAYALYTVNDRGEWPPSWPRELEPLRKQSRTFVGPQVLNRHYAIPFTKREEFESAWPHILKVKGKGVPVRLVRGPNFFLGENGNAGVVIHCPPLGQSDEPATIELVADGEIVDLNRIPLPADTPIVDERFKDRKNEASRPSGG
jgi:hypothetical protein